MLDSLIHWLGSRSCAALDAAAGIFYAQYICTYPQQWNIGLVLLSAAGLAIVYIVVRSRR